MANTELWDTVETAFDNGWFTTALAPSTQRVHTKRIARVRKFCVEVPGTFDPMTQDMMLLFCQWLATHPGDITPESRIPSDARRRMASSPATITLYVDAVDAYHRHHGYLSVKTPLVRDWLAGYRRLWAADGNRSKRSLALSTDQLRSILTAIDEGALDWVMATKERNLLRRAFMAMYVTWGFVGMMRPMELAAIQIPWVSTMPTGLLVRQPRTKNRVDGRDIFLPTATDSLVCPVGAFNRWIQAVEPFGGVPDLHLFARVTATADSPLRSPGDAPDPYEQYVRLGQEAGQLLKQAADTAGVEIHSDRFFLSSYALRRGGATSAFVEGSATTATIRRALGHRNPATTALYIDLPSQVA